MCLHHHSASRTLAPWTNTRVVTAAMLLFSWDHVIETTEGAFLVIRCWRRHVARLVFAVGVHVTTMSFAKLGSAIVALVILTGGCATLVGASTKSSEVAVARRALLVRSDFPSGWTTSSAGNNSPSNLGVPQMASCLGVPAKVVNYNPPTANSPEFDLTNAGLSVNDSVAVFPSASIGRQQFNVYGSSSSPVCFAHALNTPSVKAVFERQIGDGAKIGLVAAGFVATPRVAKKATAMEIQIPFVLKGRSFQITITQVIILSKSLTEGAELTFTSFLSPFPSSLESQLDATTAARL